MSTRETKLEEKLEKGSEVAHTAMLNRGGIIELVSDIENELTNIITWCFYPARYSAKRASNELLNKNGIIFKSIILNKLDLVDKTRMLKEVILAKRPDIWNSYSHLINDIIFKLDKVRVFRNLMAHASSDLSDEYLKSLEPNASKRNKEFQVLEFKKGKLIKCRINQSKIEIEKHKCIRTILRLSQLFYLINGDHENYTEFQKLVDLVTPLTKSSNRI